MSGWHAMELFIGAGVVFGCVLALLLWDIVATMFKSYR